MRWLQGLVVVTSLSLISGTCGGNAGRVFDPTPPGSDDGGGNQNGGNNNNPPGPPSAPTDGAFMLLGRPKLSALFPASGSQEIDVQAPVVLWFSESINVSTVNTTTIGIRPRGSAGSVAYTLLNLIEGRCLALLPASNLQTDTVYEVFVTSDLTDLDGKRFKVPQSGIVGSFRTATVTSGLPPQVLGALPFSGESGVPNDHAAVLVFSKPILFETLSNGVNLTQGGNPASFGTAVSHANDRIIEYQHLDDAADLGVLLELAVDTSITDREFETHPLETPFFSSWTTATNARPTAIRIMEDPPAANGSNLSAFSVEVDLPARSSDGTLFLLVQEALSSGRLESQQSVLAGGASTVSFELNLEKKVGEALLRDGPLVLAAYWQADGGGERTTARVLDGVLQDTVPPTLSRFGPPFASVPSVFYTDLAEIRPYGLASEPIAKVIYNDNETTTKERETSFPSPNDFFIGPAVEPGGFDEAELEFTLQLTDAAGNSMEQAAGGTAVRRGFLGNQAAQGELRVVAFDSQSLQPLNGAQVYVQNATGTAWETMGTTGTDGVISFDDRDAPGVARHGPQTVTIVEPGYHSITIFAVDSSSMSIPLRPQSTTLDTVSPNISGASTGTVQLASPLLRESGSDRLDGQLSVDLPLSFSTVEVRPDRPGWFAGFHGIQPYDGDSGTPVYGLVALEPRVLLDPSGDDMPQISPILVLGPSDNQMNGTSEFVYQATLTGGLGLDQPIAESSASLAARIPGLDGPALLGVGPVSGTNAEAELEEGFLAVVAAEGGDQNQVAFRVYLQDDEGDQALVREFVTVTANPGSPVALDLPDIPVVGAPLNQDYPVTLSFLPSLAGPGYYHLTIQDSDSPSSEWDLWLPRSFENGGQVELPTLAQEPGGSGDAPPLLTGTGNAWTVSAEAYEMRSGFQEVGVYFTQFRRDHRAVARAIAGDPFTVTLP